MGWAVSTSVPRMREPVTLTFTGASISADELASCA
jgi:hypothetical protein